MITLEGLKEVNSCDPEPSTARRPCPTVAPLPGHRVLSGERDVYPGAWHVATVHDELVLDAPADMAKQYCGMVRDAMIDAFTEMFGTEVPVEVEAKVCANWSEK
jgi:hypothetical protein